MPLHIPFPALRLPALRRPAREGLLGIDIGSSAVKLVELSRLSGGYRIETQAIEPLPPRAVAEGEILAPEEVARALQLALQRSRSRARQAAVALPGAAVISKTLEVEAGLSEDELESLLRLEADQHIPYPIDEVALDFEVLGPAAGGRGRVEVLLAACRREQVERREALLELAGLQARVVEVENHALERACTLLDEAPDGLLAVFDVGAGRTTLSVLQAGRTLYSREQAFGARQLGETLQQQLGVDALQAERLLRQGELESAECRALLEPFAEALAQQLARALQFFFAAGQHAAVGRILLAGGCAALPGLAERIGERLGVPCRPANPFAAMRLGSRVDAAALAGAAPALMTACGLALRGFD